jgi:SOS-response transcriptional repressor LexA
MSRRYIGPRQREALAAIQSHWRAYGEAPTREELGRALGGITKVSAHLLVRKLQAAGLVTVAPGMRRNVEAVGT